MNVEDTLRDAAEKLRRRAQVNKTIKTAQVIEAMTALALLKQKLGIQE